MPAKTFHALSSRRLRPVLLLAAVALGAFLWWTVSPLFLNQRVNEATTSPQSSVLAQGEFRGADSFHRVSGTARVLEQDGQLVLRLEDDFNSTNGPDLYVWLARGDTPASGYLEVAALKGNQGAQNYALPEGTDITRYRNVLIWCRAFRTLFGTAALDSQPGGVSPGEAP